MNSSKAEKVEVQRDKTAAVTFKYNVKFGVSKTFERMVTKAAFNNNVKYVYSL